MAPEVLNDTINMSDFESFKAADVYALGLVFWEICQRCQVSNSEVSSSPPSSPEEELLLTCSSTVPTSEEFKLPYWEFVGSDPSLEEMRKVVCLDRLRPEVPAQPTTAPGSPIAGAPPAGGSQRDIVREMHSLMKECWYDSAAAR